MPVLVGGVVLLVLAGCGIGARAWSRDVSGGGPAPVGSSMHQITVGGQVRTYHLYRPANLSTSAPLVVMLHGGFGTGAQAEQAYGWDQQADAAGFLVAYPDGLNRAWNVGGGCCGVPAQNSVDDVGFLTAMVRQIQAGTDGVTVDAHRIYATGISNGGMMAYTLACRTDIFAAIGPDSATQLGECPGPRPLSVIHIHGTADHNIPYNGGQGQGPGHIDGPSAPAVDATWRGIDGCAAPVVTTQPPVTTSIATCPGGRAIELITIDGAGHQWPGGHPNTVGENLLHLDPPSPALNATTVIWDFFGKHPQ
jgi:polyhydroxybutyrate depolymerase